MTSNLKPMQKNKKQEFMLPKDWRIYIQEILDRCENLIHYSIWNGIHVTRLRRWISNFITDEERYFAACVLDFLIYRSEEQTLALIKQFFQRTLPDLARLNPMPIPQIHDWEYALRHSPPLDPGIRLVTAVRQSDPHTKSAHVIARYMKRYLSVNESWIIKPWEIVDHLRKGIVTFIFIDDFLGTGDQFKTFLKMESLSNLFNSIYAAYVPLVAHVKGIDYLRHHFPNLRVRSVETLDNSYSVFNDECSCFWDGTNTPHSAKKFYFDLLRRKRIGITGPERRGYGHLELAYAFSHAAPDNCLPIFWWHYTNTWNPLFDR